MLIKFKLEDDMARADYKRLNTEVQNIVKDLEDSARAQADVFELHNMGARQRQKIVDDTAKKVELLNDAFKSLQRSMTDLIVLRADTTSHILSKFDGTLAGAMAPEALALRMNGIDRGLADVSRRVNVVLEKAEKLEGYEGPARDLRKKLIEQLKEDLQMHFTLSDTVWQNQNDRILALEKRLKRVETSKRPKKQVKK